MDIAKYMDYTNLKAESTLEDIKQLCYEAKEYGFASVCIHPSFIEDAKFILKDSDVKVCTVIGFPLGANSVESKVFEAKTALEAGADEIDMVMHIGRLKSGDVDYVTEEIRKVVQQGKEMNPEAVIKVIIECCLLSEAEKYQACQCVQEAGAQFIKTSTGFAASGAMVEDVRLMKKAIGHTTKIKAAGGIRDYATALQMIEAGADRIGVSTGITIVQESMKQ